MSVEDHVIHLENGQLAADTPPAKVRAIVDAALAHGGNGIVIHFHGGLVSYSSGMGTAEKLYTEYLDADAYPVFFVWESGLVETIKNNLGQIAQESFFKIVWKRLVNIVMRKSGQRDTHRAGGELPPVDDSSVQEAIDKALDDLDSGSLESTEPDVGDTLTELSDLEVVMLENELLLDGALTAAVEQISNGLRTPDEITADLESRSATVRGSAATLMDLGALNKLVDRPDPTSRGVISTATMIKAVVSLASSVISRFIRGRDHGFHATVVEEILRTLYVANVGGLIWSQMKQDTHDAFGADDQVHGGTAFLAALRTRIDAGATPRITLVGHSTGAEFVLEFLNKAASMLPSAVKYGVVFEAPASTFEKTAATLSQHSALIDGFRMFTMLDEHERNDQLVPVLYPHSLLYFVSGVVEPDADSPVVGMHRFYDAARFPDNEFPSVGVVRNFVEESADRAVWSVTPTSAPDGRRSAATRHTEFDDEDESTIESVKYILTHGF